MVPDRYRFNGTRVVSIAASCGAELEATDQYETAIECYLRGIDADPIVESFYIGLMRCYLRLGRHSEAASTYRRLRQTLSVVVGVRPSGEAERLFESLLGANSPAAGEETNTAFENSNVRKLQKRSG